MIDSGKEPFSSHSTPDHQVQRKSKFSTPCSWLSKRFLDPWIWGRLATSSPSCSWSVWLLVDSSLAWSCFSARGCLWSNFVAMVPKDIHPDACGAGGSIPSSSLATTTSMIATPGRHFGASSPSASLPCLLFWCWKWPNILSTSEMWMPHENFFDSLSVLRSLYKSVFDLW